MFPIGTGTDFPGSMSAAICLLKLWDSFASESSPLSSSEDEALNPRPDQFRFCLRRTFVSRPAALRLIRRRARCEKRPLPNPRLSVSPGDARCLTELKPNAVPKALGGRSLKCSIANRSPILFGRCARPMLRLFASRRLLRTTSCVDDCWDGVPLRYLSPREG